MYQEHKVIDITANGAAAAGPCWRTSTHSALIECVEVASLDGTIGVRNSRDPKAGVLIVPRAVFGALIEQIKAGELDDLGP